MRRALCVFGIHQRGALGEGSLLRDERYGCRHCHGIWRRMFGSWVRAQ